MSGQVVTSVALLFEIVGVMLLAFFAFPPNPDATIWIASPEPGKWRVERRWTRVAIALIVAGLGFQLWAVWLPRG